MLSEAVSRRAAVLDIGGTSLKSGLVDLATGAIDGLAERPSPEGASAPQILDELGEALRSVLVVPSDVVAVVVSVPGPFDHARGVSLMRHKFESLYGRSLVPAIRTVVDLEPIFVNDADAAGVGVWSDQGSSASELGIVTLGTGVGSTLLRDGVPHGDRRNELWSMPYEDGIFEDYVSSSALRQRSQERGIGPIQVVEIAARARDGCATSGAVFAEFGRHLGIGLATHFAPDSPIVVTGKISRAWDLFGGATVAGLRATGSAARVSISSTSHPALRGGAVIARRALT